MNGWRRSHGHSMQAALGRLRTVSFSFQMLPDESVIKTAYAAGQDSEQKFIANLALFLCTFLKEHGTLVEVNPDQADQRELAEAHSVV